MNDPTLNNETGVIQILRSPVWLKAGPFLFFTVLYVVFFSPVIFAGRLLAYSDAVFYSIPNFYAPRTLWTNLLFSGYPVAADPQTQTWYPLAVLFSLLPNSWNAYIISGYVLSGCFMFGYVRTMTQSQLAGLVAGVSYSMSGFMIGRLVQIPLIHAAVWLPLIFWALEKNRQDSSTGWTVMGSLAIACSFLGGHTQIFFYGMIVASTYVIYMGWNSGNRRWSNLWNFSWMVLMGVGLVCIQLLPTLELAEWSSRASLSYSDFISFSLSPKEIMTLLFPYLFGGGGTVYDVEYFGSGNGMELPAYLGLLTLLLVCLAVVGSWSSRVVRFWLITFLVAFVMALGEYTPLSQLMFYLPGFNKFRAPVRHFLEISLAVSVLAGLGADCIRRREISSKQIKRVVLGVVGVFGLCLAMIWIFSDTLEQTAIQKGVEIPGIVSWKNAALWMPVLILTLAAGALVFWWNHPESVIRRGLILLVLVVDLASYGWFHYWHYFAPRDQWIQPPDTVRPYRTELNASHQRLLQVEGIHGERNQFPVNISRLWGIPSATGYNPLILSRVKKVLSIYESGVLLDTWASVKHRALDIFGVRYLILPKDWLSSYQKANGTQWTGEELGIRLGNGCNLSFPSSIEFSLPQEFTASHIGIVSKSFCAADVSDGTAVLNIRFFSGKNLKSQADLVMGRDTAEWGYDCGGVGNPTQHKQASIFQAVSADSSSGAPCHGYQYVSRIPISSARSLKQIQMKWLGNPGYVQLDKITLIDENSGRVLPLRELTASSHWRFKEKIGNKEVYENLDAMPRAWLVPEVLTVKSQDMLHAIYYSKLPDGRPFDPVKTALIEEPYALKNASSDPSGRVDIVQLEDTEIVLQTQSMADSFLITSDIYYPGWQATLDGRPVPVYRANYTLRGISLPAGSHEVRFQYRPQSFYIGMTVSIFSLLVLFFWFFRRFSTRNT